MKGRFKFIRQERNLGWFGIGKYALYDEELGIIKGYIAKRKGQDLFGRKATIYTAIYPNAYERRYVYKEFERFKDAKEWLLEEMGERI